MYAQICIDIPAAQVNHSFTYHVPESMQELIELGMRVHVPFGNRQLMGIVVGLSPNLEEELSGPVKDISELMDLQSFLTPELVALSDQLAQEIFAFRISILMAMLPNMLKAKYETVFIIHDWATIHHYQTQVDLNQNQILEENSRPSRKWMEDRFPAQIIKQWIDAGIIELQYLVIDQTTQKYEKVILPQLSLEEYRTIQDQTPERYHKQHLVLQALIDYQDQKPILQEALQKQYDLKAGDFKTAIEKGWIAVEERPVYRDPLENQSFTHTQARQLTDQQTQAYQAVAQAMDQAQAQTFLLHGVTGSGKTEVYLQLLAKARDKGQTAILLVPEIALTPQMINQVRGRFQTGVAVLHSGLSVAEKYDEWRRIKSGQAKIVIGARSSIFAPVENLGLIIIDEEHETTYKQSDHPRYHARDVAVIRSKHHQCPLVLGSATPSLESMARAKKGNYCLISMTRRVNQRPLPPVDIVDMTQVGVKQHAQQVSPILAQKIQDRLHKRQQVMILLNRRGYASYVQCRECGHVLECPNCDISLTYHKYEHQLKCHYCQHHQAMVQTCPQCGSPHIQSQGLGTQQVSETLQMMFPEAKILRMDNDTTRKKNAHRKLLKQFANHEADILVGTQMIAKGLDFENVTLVGVINADTSLNIPDFRASEKTFQLLTQVSGRAGRGQLAGEVVIQTYNPDHYVLQLSQLHDYEHFFLREMQYRHMAKYPPYYFTSLITVHAKLVAPAQQVVYEIRNQLLEAGANQSDRWLVLGPSQGPIARMKNHYYFQLLLKYKNKQDVNQVLETILNDSQAKGQKGVYISIDHEPLHFI